MQPNTHAQSHVDVPLGPRVTLPSKALAYHVPSRILSGHGPTRSAGLAYFPDRWTVYTDTLGMGLQL